MMKKAPQYPNRVREIRNSKNPKMTLEKLSELTELSVGYLSKIEAGKQPLSARIMPKIAGALGVRPAELIDSATAWLEVDIVGVISDDNEIKPVNANGSGRQKMTAEVPAALAGTNAVLVVGNHLSPRYSDGDVITYSCHDDDNFADLIGKECVVTLTNNLTYLKTIMPGSKPGLYLLTSFNTPPLYDVEIEAAGLVGWIDRA